MILPGLVSVTFKGKPAEKVIELCQQAHICGIEWSENSHVQPNDVHEAERLYALCTAAGIQIAAYGSYCRFGQHEDDLARFKESLACAKAMHAPLIRIWAGRGASCDIDDATRSKWAEEARVMCSLAAQNHIKVAFEWHRNTLTDTNESGIRFIQEVNHENCYSLWQPTVALTIKQRIEGLDLLGDKLLNVHTFYWRGDERRPFEEGIHEWKQYFEHIDTSKDRYALLEFVMDDSEKQFVEDAKALHSFLEAYHE